MDLTRLTCAHATCRALAAEARVAKEVDRLKVEQGSEDLEDLKPDKDMFDIIHSTTRPLPEHLKSAALQEPSQAEAVAQEALPDMSAQEVLQVYMGRALRLAAASANFGEVIELQAAGANVNAPEAVSGMTPLHLACFFGAIDVARSLIAGGADKNAVDAFGRSCKQTLPQGSILIQLFDPDSSTL